MTSSKCTIEDPLADVEEIERGGPLANVDPLIIEMNLPMISTSRNHLSTRDEQAIGAVVAGALTA